MRKTMIVAVARKLAIALWRYVEHGLVPQGAILNPPRTATAVVSGTVDHACGPFKPPRDDTEQQDQMGSR
jgi:hypothetical protein